MKFLRVLAGLVIVVSLAATGHIAVAFLQPPSGSDRVSAQVRWLNRAIADGAPRQMQQLFPEGAFFTHVLTGLAAGSVGDLPTVSATLAASGAPAIKAGFGSIEALDGGTFYRGWRLLLAANQVRLSGAGAADLLAEARAVEQALLASSSGVPASYPNGYWPCDAVVAMAAVVRARDAVGAPIDTDRLAAWRARLAALRDPTTGLLAHRIGADGAVLEGPRGSSQAIIQAFWPQLDPVGAPEQWRAFRTAFVTTEVGLVGVREFPSGDTSPGDVDSGPLIFGVSASASAVTLAAARANGDADVAAGLDHEAEYLGIPLEWFGERRFAFGVLPVGDAFVAWARGVPLATAPPATPPAAPTVPQWVWHALIALIPAVLCGVWLARSSDIRPRLPPKRRPEGSANAPTGNAAESAPSPNDSFSGGS